MSDVARRLTRTKAVVAGWTIAFAAVITLWAGASAIGLQTPRGQLTFIEDHLRDAPGVVSTYSGADGIEGSHGEVRLQMRQGVTDEELVDTLVLGAERFNEQGNLRNAVLTLEVDDESWIAFDAYEIQTLDRARAERVVALFDRQRESTGYSKIFRGMG